MSPSRPNTTERLIPASWEAMMAHEMPRMSAWSVLAMVGRATTIRSYPAHPRGRRVPHGVSAIAALFRVTSGRAVGRLGA